MAYNAAALMYQRVLFFDRCILNLRMCKQPCLIQSVYQKLRPLITCFPSKKHREPDAFPLCLCMLISETEAPYPLLPRQGTVHRSISVKKVIRYNNAGVPCLFVGARHLGTRAAGACACLRCMHMCLIQVSLCFHLHAAPSILPHIGPSPVSQPQTVPQSL